MFNENQIDALRSATAYCKDGSKIGAIGDVYLDDQTGQPNWVTINTGLFGTKTSFAPLEGATLEGDRLNLAYGKDQVTSAPAIDEDGHLEVADEQELYRHYNVSGYDTAYANTTGTYDRDHGADNGADAGANFATTGAAYDRDHGADNGADAGANVRRDADVRRGVDTDATAVAREEQLVVGKEQREAGQVRLRKYTTTEQQNITVPVTKEKLVVEREPGRGVVTDGVIGDRDGMTDEVITLREEVPVVQKQVVETERVHVGKEAVTEQHQVTDQVRKEHIEVEGDGVVRDGVRNEGVVGDRAFGKDGFVDADRDGKDDRKLTEKVDNFIDRHDGDNDPNR